MPDLTIRPATIDDVKRFYPEIRASFIAWVAELDGAVEGMLALVLTRPYACIISRFSEPLRPYLGSVKVMRYVKRMQALCKKRGGTVLAVQDANEETSPLILHRLGFVFREETHGQKVYEMRCGNVH